MYSLFRDGPEYIKRKNTPFRPSDVTLSELHSVVPKHLYRKSTAKGLAYVTRDVLCAVAVYKLGWRIEPLVQHCIHHFQISPLSAWALNWTLWGLYWYLQGVILAGWWCLAHEAGHGTLSPQGWVNHLVGFSLHTFILVPYYAWRSTHHAHHKATMSIERDENYVPRTRSDYRLPAEKIALVSDYHEVFEETPIYTLCRMLFMQLLGWQYYLLTNIMGNPKYPPGTNHFQPSSPLFKPHERNGIIASNLGLGFMSLLLWRWGNTVGSGYFVKLYLVPYLLANHWIVMLTYLHHSDPTIPHYRKNEWTFLRGAISTVDRPLLGWFGRFFLHNVSHDHVAHHLFSTIPFYNQPQVTEAIKKVLKDDYNFDSTNTFRALYRTFTQCCFIEDDGDVVFYKNRDGVAIRVLAQKDSDGKGKETGKEENSEKVEWNPLHM
ncbi:fatty acid conjugase [Coprinopsis cinerea okayama7|uniref:Fatty acid conjugase n=1 Tax=Coprinopsis cinerea (strain Okayama-7 / 130 / ATCC MYA-4618 / FGSC 9003) TaxID=240176 RepID=A8PB92_COPC7|nr:fatty acid conjugase [Coprinopsis cinerea okayama7\|eukprot:XP_001840126.1 fatty acid conjugase [Coprinopsis cinerea okayama7\